MITSLLLLLLTFYFLSIICDDFFVPSLEKIAHRLKMSSDFAGATLMAIGSSAPELFVSLFAILNPHVTPGLGASTIVGSAIFNILVIVGASLIARGVVVKLQWQSVMRDLIFYGIAIGLLLIMFQDGRIVASEMLIFVFMYIIYVVSVKYWSVLFHYTPSQGVSRPDIPLQHIEKGRCYLGNSTGNENQCIGWRKLGGKYVRHFMGLIIPKNMRLSFGVSIFLIAVVTHFMVEYGVLFARSVGLSEVLIGLTVLAVGTSISDLLSSWMVAKQGYADMAVSNAIGSNVFDILVGLSIPYLIYFMFVSSDTFVSVDTSDLLGSITLLLITVLLLIMIFFTRRWRVGKRVGWFLVVIYVIYLGYEILMVV